MAAGVRLVAEAARVGDRAHPRGGDRGAAGLRRRGPLGRARDRATRERGMIATERLYPIRRPLSAACAGAAVAILGGLIGLGGAEFRLPILIAIFALYAHRAIRINLLISLVTLAMSAVSRLSFVQATNIADLSRGDRRHVGWRYRRRLVRCSLPVPHPQDAHHGRDRRPSARHGSTARSRDDDAREPRGRR